jgi:hypothetical protein
MADREIPATQSPLPGGERVRVRGFVLTGYPMILASLPSLVGEYGAGRGLF